jgi:hypothetical protein
MPKIDSRIWLGMIVNIFAWLVLYVCFDLLSKRRLGTLQPYSPFFVIALWLRSASLPLVDFVSYLTLSRFVRFCCQLSLKFRYSPDRKIRSS